MTVNQTKLNERMKASGATLGSTRIAPERTDKTVEGLRVPPDLDFFPSCELRAYPGTRKVET